MDEMTDTTRFGTRPVRGWRAVIEGLTVIVLEQPGLWLMALAGSARTILGIDPGLEVTGYAIVASDGSAPQVREAGVLRTSPGSAAAVREGLVG